MGAFDFMPQMGASQIPGGGFTMPAPKPKGGMFGNTDWTGAITAALNGYLAAGGNPAGVAGLQQLHQQKMAEAEAAAQAQQYQQQQADQRNNFMFEQDYKAAHPETPDITQRIAALNQIKPGLGDTYAQNYAQNGGGLGTLFKDPATGQSYALPSGGASSGPQPGAVEDGYRFKGGNPADPNAWEPVAGGAGGNASGGFPY